MDKPKPTPGPWAVKNLNSKNTIFIVSENSYVAQTPDFGTEKSPQELADAERIVSCVNAMDGIEDPALLRACFDEILREIRLAYNSVPDGYETIASGEKIYDAEDTREFEETRNKLGTLISKAESLRVKSWT